MLSIVLVTCFIATAIYVVEGGFIIGSYESRAQRSKQRNMVECQHRSQKDTLLWGYDTGNDVDTDTHDNANDGFQTSEGDGKGMDKVVMVQTGFGCCHGRDATKASIRAVRDAIDSNSVKVRTANQVDMTISKSIYSWG